MVEMVDLKGSNINQETKGIRRMKDKKKSLERGVGGKGRWLGNRRTQGEVGNSKESSPSHEPRSGLALIVVIEMWL